MTLEKGLLLRMLKQMIEIRAFEEKMQDMYARGEAVGIIHLSNGQEAVAVGTCANLKKDDYIVSNHRGHHHCIAKGGDVRLMMAELFGRKTGYCKGKGGSMHLTGLEFGHLGSIGIVGSGIPVAVGAALSAKRRRSDQVAVGFFGDGASDTGSFHEGLNFASLQRLPAIFVCENNFYAVSTHQKRHQAITDIADRACAYGMPGVVLDGNDVVAVYEAVREATSRARAGQGPTLLECKTYRTRGHHEGDPSRGTTYRTKEEIAEWMEKDPIKRLADKLLEDRLITEPAVAEMKGEAESLMEEAASFAKGSPYPDPEDILKDLYVDEDDQGAVR